MSQISSLATPTFSIIIPTHARPERLTTCLQALYHLDYPRSLFEVIVVDDGSPTPLTRLVETWYAQLAITLITQPQCGPAHARNTGATQAQYTYLAFTDDDCAPASDWLSAFAAQLSSLPNNAIGGRVVNALPQNPFSTASQDLVTDLYSHFNADPNHARFCTSNNLVVPVDQFKAIGGFDPHFKFAAGEDRDFCDRWLAGGRDLTYLDRAVVYHSHTLSFTSFWRQQFNYGRGAYYFHKFKAQRHKTATQFEDWQFYFNLVAQPFKPSPTHRLRHVGLGLLRLLSQVATVSGYFWATRLEGH